MKTRKMIVTLVILVLLFCIPMNATAEINDQLAAKYASGILANLQTESPSGDFCSIWGRYQAGSELYILLLQYPKVLTSSSVKEEVVEAVRLKATSEFYVAMSSLLITAYGQGMEFPSSFSRTCLHRGVFSEKNLELADLFQVIMMLKDMAVSFEKRFSSNAVTDTPFALTYKNTEPLTQPTLDIMMDVYALKYSLSLRDLWKGVKTDPRISPIVAQQEIRYFLTKREISPKELGLTTTEAGQIMNGEIPAAEPAKK